MKTERLSNGYTLKICTAVAPEGCILYQRTSDVFRDVIQDHITEEACLQHLGRIPEIGEKFELPFFKKGHPCLRIPSNNPIDVSV